MDFITLEQLQEIEESGSVTKVECNGFSGRDGSSTWYTVYYVDGTERDFYII